MNENDQLLLTIQFHLQKNSKLQFGQGELLRLLSYLEGELQARDVVIAALKVNSLLLMLTIS